MKQKAHVFIRQHHNGWYTASLLVRPRYASYGPHPSALLEELATVVGRDLGAGELTVSGEMWFEDIRRRTLSLELKAIQHDRLTMVPMRFTVLVRSVVKDGELFEVRIPRLDETFTIFGEENVEPWSEETIRGRFHLASIEEVLSYQYERSERLAEIEVAPRGKKKRKGPAPDDSEEAAHPLESVAVDMTKEAADDRLRGALYRESDVGRLVEILCSRRAPSALVVGHEGAGKTAVIEELARRLAGGRVPPRIAGARLWRASGGRMVAGATFLGDWQERARQVVDTVSREKDLLYLGDLGELITAGSKRSGLDVAQFFVTPIESGEISVILETTPDGLIRAERINPALVRAFQQLHLDSLSPVYERALIETCAERSAREVGAELLPEAVTAAVDVTARFGDASAFPGAAIDLLDRAARLHTDRARPIGREDALRAFSTTSGLPQSLVDPEHVLAPQDVRGFFRERVIGQDAATDLLTDVLLILKAGLNDPEKPLGSFLFMGPTGVGKTEASLTLAEYLFDDRDRVIRFDMSEYGHPGSAVRLIDGAGGEGELTKRVREQPFSVLLFDELEKADPGVFDLLLQLLGEGRLTDGTGRTVRFVHTIVVMTSNLGAEQRHPLGFDEEIRAAGERYVEAAERFFRPELVNRFDHLVPFSPLSRADLRRIARRLLDDAMNREGFSRRNVELTYDAVLLDHLARIGYDPRYGARPMKRAIESFVIVPLAKRLVASKPTKETLRLTVEEDALSIR